MSKTTYVDREEASKILKVSTRTVDRYMRKYRFKTRKDGRRVLIKRTDVDKIIKEQIGRLVDIKDENLNEMLDANKAPAETKLAVKDVKVEKVSSKNEVEEKIYKDLYTEVKGELKEKQERLEAATYRVGQLEAEVKNMVPALDFDKQEKQLVAAKAEIDQKEKENRATIIRMEAKLRSERVAKWIYLSLVGLLLVAEPILFLLWAVN